MFFLFRNGLYFSKENEKDIHPFNELNIAFFRMNILLFCRETQADFVFAIFTEAELLFYRCGAAWGGKKNVSWSNRIKK